MSFFDNFGAVIKNHFDKKKENREMMERLQREADFQRREIFQEEYRKNALEVAKSKAMKDAAKLSGLQKLRALNRARNLTNTGEDQGNFFGKLASYTQKNIAKREENLKRTEEMRMTAKQMRENQLKEAQRKRVEHTVAPKKPFYTH